MMRQRITRIFQYVLILGVTTLLVWLAMRNLAPVDSGSRWRSIWLTWKDSDKSWLIVMAGLALLSHWLRAVRWKMLLVPAGQPVKTLHSMLSLMIGYLVNLAIPRGGEVSRCYNLLKLDGTPVEISLGTVVTERVIDVVCLLLLLLISFFVEWGKLTPFLSDLFSDSDGDHFQLSTGVWIGVVLLAIILFALWTFRNHPRVTSIISGFRVGLLSVFQVKQKGLFIVLSITIWVLYFVMSYCVLQAFDETRSLGLSAVLGVFAIGSVAMAAPLPGGTGSYHVLVPIALTSLYGVAQDSATAFTFVFHGWQTLIMIMGGIVSLLISYFFVRWKKRPIRSGT